MHRLHPLWRGFYLALFLMVTLLLTGGPDAVAPYQGQRRPLALALAVTVGAFLAMLPSRLRRRSQAASRPSWQRCLGAFFCGTAMVWALGMAGGGRILPALMTGSAGAYAFAAAAWTAGFVTTRAMGRRRGA